jgi:hypothetical protein
MNIKATLTLILLAGATAHAEDRCDPERYFTRLSGKFPECFYGETGGGTGPERSRVNKCLRAKCEAQAEEKTETSLLEIDVE